MSLLGAIENSARAAFFEKHLVMQQSRLDRKDKTYLMKELRRYGMHNEAGIVLRGVRTNGMTDQELGEFAAFAGNYVTEEEFPPAHLKDENKTAAS